MPRALRHARGFCLVLLLLAASAAPRPAAAQTGEAEFAELASVIFGMVCLFLPAEDQSDGARVLGLTPVLDPALVARIMPGGPARAWSLLHTGRVLLIARREDAACLMDLVGVEESGLFDAIDRMLRRLHRAVYQVFEETVPRGLPPPSLRARYRLTTQDNAAFIVEFRVEQSPGVGRRVLVVLRAE
ncbi:hypothetical protein [Plastoroseomonas arctica]|uniref:Uncharacterized protein n=1 Tax=Plastoroseomonas arctica TaxID=1509237 RepID=A0AAF1KKU7_9PROT|nr:hypothetical protein [Plastoroseomonas arctica]MBR0653936.1 hypothetical protein [Plastoroseomonas arctica]